MITHQKEPYISGYNTITTRQDLHAEMFMDIGVIKLNQGEVYTTSENLERAILLIEGEVILKWNHETVRIKRQSCIDENPLCLHLPMNVSATIEGIETSELMYQAIENPNLFEPKLYMPEDTASDIFGKDVLDNTSIRTVRTIIDDDIAPYSNLVIGEVINHPGRWSSYPPHKHVQPEVYHYRFFPEMGFGISMIGEEACKIEHRSTSLVTTNVVHPQCSAPGYAMYYVWMIPHKPKRWLKDREFDEKHIWLLEK